MYICCLRKTENDSSRQVIDLLNGNWTWMGNMVWFVDDRGWGICVFVDGGIWGMDVFVDGGIWGMEDGRIGRIANGGNLKLKQI